MSSFTSTKYEPMNTYMEPIFHGNSICSHYKTVLAFLMTKRNLKRNSMRAVWFISAHFSYALFIGVDIKSPVIPGI